MPSNDLHSIKNLMTKFISEEKKNKYITTVPRNRILLQDTIHFMSWLQQITYTRMYF